MSAMEVIERGENYIIYKSGSQKLLKLENVRFSYPHFGEAREDENDDGKATRSWNGVAMLPKKTHEKAKLAFQKIMNEILADVPNGKGGKGIKIESQHKPLKDGDEKDDEAMHGHWLISFSEKGKIRPSARTVRGEVIDSVERIDEIFYGGCWGSVMLRPWYFDGKAKNSTKTYPKRVCCGYNGVQFLRDDTPFGNGRIDDSDAWGDASDGNDSGDDDLGDDDL